MEATLNSLPDEVLLNIGVRVSEYGIRNFLHLSQTSKRFQSLLTESQDLVDKIIKARIATIPCSIGCNEAFGCQSAMGCPMGSRTSRILSTKAIQTLQQLDLCETLIHHHLLEENRLLLFPHSPFEEEFVTRIVLALECLLPIHPSLRVVLNHHQFLPNKPKLLEIIHKIESRLLLRAQQINQILTTEERKKGTTTELRFVLKQWDLKSLKTSAGRRYHRRELIEATFEIDGGGGGGTTTSTTNSSTANEKGKTEAFELPPRHIFDDKGFVARDGAGGEYDVRTGLIFVRSSSA